MRAGIRGYYIDVGVRGVEIKHDIDINEWMRAGIRGYYIDVGRGGGKLNMILT